MLIATSETIQKYMRWLQNCFLVMRTFKIYSLRNFQIYNTVLLTIFTMLYLISPDLIYLITGTFLSFDHLPKKGCNYAW